MRNYIRVHHKTGPYVQNYYYFVKGTNWYWFFLGRFTVMVRHTSGGYL